MPQQHILLTTAVITAAAILIGCSQAPAPSVAATPSTSAKQPGTNLSVDQLKAQMFHLSAGRRLKPPSWPNNAKVAVSLSFDVDNATTQLRSGDLGSEVMSRGEYGAVDG